MNRLPKRPEKLPKKEPGKREFDWRTFDLKKFLEDAKKVGEILRKTELREKEYGSPVRL